MTTLATPTPQIDRDRYGRPLVIPPGGGKPTPYTRCTTYIDCLEDKFNLQKWMLRMVALGLASRPDLLLSVSAHRDDKKELDRICDAAKEAAASSAKATTGTALHALTELIDRGEQLPVVPPNALASLEAYRTGTSDLKVLDIERFLVLDTLKIGGTTDRIVRHGRDVKIADTKTGSIEWGALKIAMQLAIYARSWAYDIATGERAPHGASTTEGIVIHLPSVDDPADAKCDLYAVDLEAGWFAVQVATQVREKRNLKFGQLMHPLGTERTSKPPRKVADQLAAGTAVDPLSLEDRVKSCASAEDVRALWLAHQAQWSDDLTATAQQHIASLPAVS